jgi:hypothetical protein
MSTTTTRRAIPKPVPSPAPKATELFFEAWGGVGVDACAGVDVGDADPLVNADSEGDGVDGDCTPMTVTVVGKPGQQLAWAKQGPMPQIRTFELKVVRRVLADRVVGQISRQTIATIVPIHTPVSITLRDTHPSNTDIIAIRCVLAE